MANALICTGSDNPTDEQNLEWALDATDGGVSLYEPNPAFAGYSLYDAIGVVDITGYVRQCGERRHVTEIGTLPEATDRPDRLFVIGTVTLQGALMDWQIETDLILFAEAETTMVEESALCLAKDATSEVNDLVDLMTRSLFCPSDDFDAGSYDSQLQWFTDEAEDAAVALIEDMDAVHQNQVERTIRRELYWILRPPSKITIEIKGSNIEIHGLETAFQTAKAA